MSSCSLTTSNEPILMLNDGRAYSYCPDLKTWVQLSNPLDPVSRSATSMVKKVPSNLPLASLQRIMPPHRPTDCALPSGVTLSFLETQIAATNVLKSATEYRHWLFIQIHHLLDKGLWTLLNRKFNQKKWWFSGPECRLKLILDDLLGPTHGSAKKRRLDTEIMVRLTHQKKNYDYNSFFRVCLEKSFWKTSWLLSNPNCPGNACIKSTANSWKTLKTAKVDLHFSSI